MRGVKPLDPSIHPTTLERRAAWHAMMLGRVQARKAWPLLARHMLFEIRACAFCGEPVLRWRGFDAIRIRVLAMAVRAAGGNVSLAAQRLKMARRTLYDHLPQKLRDKIGAKLEAKGRVEGETKP